LRCGRFGRFAAAAALQQQQQQHQNIPSDRINAQLDYSTGMFTSLSISISFIDERVKQPLTSS